MIVAALLNRFYGAAAAILGRSAIIDKLVGDEVMALYLPLLLADGWEGEVLRDASDLLGSVGFGSTAEPRLRLGIGLDIGRAFVGNGGAGDVKDFTALGDLVNTAARLQPSAEAGHIVMSERLFARLPNRGIEVSSKKLAIRGKHEPEPVRVIDLAPGASNGSSRGGAHALLLSPDKAGVSAPTSETSATERSRKSSALAETAGVDTLEIVPDRQHPARCRRLLRSSRNSKLSPTTAPSRNAEVSRRGSTSRVSTTPDVKEQPAAINRCP